MKHSKTKDTTISGLVNIHFALSNLTYYNENAFAAEESIIEDFAFEELINEEWNGGALSQKTTTLLKAFRKEWRQYKRDVSYSDDPVFMFLDQRWHLIVSKYLMPALDSMEHDFSAQNIEHLPFREHYDASARPSDKTVLEKGRILYDLLLENKIITKDYI